MEQTTFQKEIKFKSNIMKDGVFNYEIVTKTATFKELNELDPTQHSLIFLVSPLFVEQKQIGGEKHMIADPIVLKDLTIEAINCLLILNNDFNIQDKVEFMNDGIALLKFAQWFIKEKFSAFFFNSIANY